MELQNYSESEMNQINHMLDFLIARAKGTIPTGAKFIRDIIVNSELYKQDSIIPPELISVLM